MDWQYIPTTDYQPVKTRDRRINSEEPNRRHYRMFPTTRYDSYVRRLEHQDRESGSKHRRCYGHQTE